MKPTAQIRCVAFTIHLAAVAAAQGTYIVDAASGPGANFSDISAALLAVPDNSVLLVRTGNYSPVTIDAKAVTILCDSNVSAGTSLTVQNTQPSQRVVVRRLQTTPWGGAGLSILSAQGPVIIDGGGGLAYPSFRVDASPNVIIRGCNSGFAFPPVYSTFVACEVTGGSRLLLEDCSFTGMGAVRTWDSWSLSWQLSAPAQPAMQVGLDGSAPSTVMMTNCHIQGGSGAVYGSPWYPRYAPPRSAIELAGASSVRIAGTSTNWVRGGVGSGPGGGFVAPALTGSGQARIDPSVLVDPAPLSTPSLSIVRPVLPTVTTTGGGIGASIDVTRFGEVGISFAIAIGWLGQPSPWTSGSDPLWLDPSATFVEAFAVATTTPFTLQRSVPNLQSLRGLTIGWQAIDFEANGHAPLSNPSVIVIR